MWNNSNMFYVLCKRLRPSFKFRPHCVFEIDSPCSTRSWWRTAMMRTVILFVPPIRDTMDSVKQSAALCLLRLNRTSPDLVPMGEWTARVVHLLNDQHLVRLRSIPHLTRSKNHLVLADCNYDMWKQTAPAPLLKHWSCSWQLSVLMDVFTHEIVVTWFSCLSFACGSAIWNAFNYWFGNTTAVTLNWRVEGLLQKATYCAQSHHYTRFFLACPEMVMAVGVIGPFFREKIVKRNFLVNLSCDLRMC